MPNCIRQLSKLVGTACLLAALIGSARADTLILKNGNRFEGRVVAEHADKVVFRTTAGTITFRRSQIEAIVTGPWVAPRKREVTTTRPPVKRVTARKPVKARKGATRKPT